MKPKKATSTFLAYQLSAKTGYAIIKFDRF